MNVTYVHHKNIYNHPTTTSIASSSVLWELGRNNNLDAPQQLHQREFDDYERIITRQPEDLLSDFIRLQSNKHVATAGSFIWEIRVSWHASKQIWASHPINIAESSLIMPAGGTRVQLSAFPAVFADPSGSPSKFGCLYIHDGIPAPMQDMVDQIWQAISSIAATNTGTRTKNRTDDAGPPHPPYIGFLHIRRGDSTSRCNTTLAKLRNYLSCSLQGVPPSLILLASDEANPEYRQSIQRMLQTKSLGHHDMVDLDALVWEQVQQRHNHHDNSAPHLHNNYYVYRIESILKTTHVDFVLQQRQRHDCPECQNVRAMLGLIL
jgi:hypothetical protein